MTALRSPPKATPLVEWPDVENELRRRGVETWRRPHESVEEHENRVGTALMVVFRDTRDRQAFDALYSFTGPGLLVWIRGLLGRELANHDPAEILQDAFVNVYRYPGAFRDDHAGSFRVWVRTIAGNVVRRATLLRRRAQPQDLGESFELEDRTPGPAQSFLDEDESQRLRRAWMLLLCFYAQAWNELGQRDRRTLHLVEVEGLSYQEAGRILAVGRSNLKMIVFRSRRRIARRMQDAMSKSRSRITPAPELVA